MKIKHTLLLCIGLGMQLIHADVQRQRTISSISKDTVGFGAVTEAGKKFKFTINAANVKAELTTSSLQNWGIDDQFDDTCGGSAIFTSQAITVDPSNIGALFPENHLIEGTYTKCEGGDGDGGGPSEFEYTLVHEGSEIKIEPAEKYVCIGEDVELEAKDKNTDEPVSIAWTFKDEDGNEVGTSEDGTTTTFSSDEPGEFTISGASSDSSYTHIEDATVTVVKVEIDLEKSTACDGEIVEVDLIVTPNSASNVLGNIQFTATKPVGGVDFDNPSGQGITISQRDDDNLEWQIDNVRWYSTQENHCNDESEYEIKATYEIDGEGCTTDEVTFTADFTPGADNCFVGISQETNFFSGDPVYTTVFNEETELWETWVTQGTFERDVQAESMVQINENSQFRDMLLAEEKFHEEDQMENPNHVRWGTAYLVANIMNEINENNPYIANFEGISLALAEIYFEEARDDEIQRSRDFLDQNENLCADETEAKNDVDVQASHRLTMTCTYPQCL